MQTRRVTLTQVLSEIKSLDKRIERSIKEGKFIHLGYAHPTSISRDKQEKQRKEASSKYQSIQDMIARRFLLKAILVQTNAVNTVTVAGQSMTIAAAIERKTSIRLEQQLLTQLCNQKAQADRELEQANRDLEQALDNLRRTCNSSNSQPMSAADVQAQIDARRRESERLLIDPLRMDETIQNLKDSIDAFLSEVDTALSVYDATTIVEVPM